VLNIRKDNILRRAAIKKELKLERENLILKKKNREDKRAFDLNEAKIVMDNYILIFIYSYLYLRILLGSQPKNE